MLETETKLLLRLCLFTFIYLMAVECRLLKTPRPNPGLVRRRVEGLAELKNFPIQFKMTNQEFCIEMILEPEDHIVVLPWWYYYCRDLRKKAGMGKGIQGVVKLSEMRKYMRQEDQAIKKKYIEAMLKKRKMQKNQNMTELKTKPKISKNKVAS